MANVAECWWCPQQAVLTSRAEELDFFTVYLIDRITYAHRLGQITRLPRRNDALLEVGNGITPDDVEKLLRKERRKAEKRAKCSSVGHVTMVFESRKDSTGNWVGVINPDLPPEEKQLAERLAAEEGIRVISLEDDPKWRGKIYQASRAEQYPSIRWNFPWGRYTVVGVPDGITDQFVYEYKTTRRLYYLGERKPIAFAQADLYGFFFRRPTKRVQILVVEEDATQTWEEPVDSANAEGTLSTFARIDAGEPARPPQAWKCRICKFRATCPISQAK
jgi:hypothetical protein